MNLIKNNWQYVIILLLLISLGLGTMAFIDMRNNYERLAFNMSQTMKDANTKMYELSKKEAKEYKAYTDSLLIVVMDSMKLKPKHIEKTFNNKYVYSYDTTIVMVINEVDTTYRDFEHVFDDCISITGRVNCYKNEIDIEKLSIDYNSTTTYYWKRKRPWLWVFSEKERYATTVNNCTGASQVIDITFIKD